MPLDPFAITPAISINRIKLMNAPDLPESLKGKMVYELISRKTLLHEITEALPALMAHSDPIPIFDELIAQQDKTALNIANTFAQRLFWLIHTLKFPHPANREARPEWDDSYWSTFAKMKQFIFGGGLMRGHLGVYMIAYAQKRLGEACLLKIAPHAPILPLLGASRHVPENTTQALIFDFGQTAIKRAIATYVEGTLTTMTILPSISPPLFLPQSIPQYIADNIVHIIADTWRSYATNHTTTIIPMSIATYLQNNHPSGDPHYGSVAQLTSNMGAFLSEKISEQVQMPISIQLIHDGTSSARVYVGEPDTVVITVGTALGIGFPVYDAPLRPISERLMIN